VKLEEYVPSSTASYSTILSLLRSLLTPISERIMATILKTSISPMSPVSAHAYPPIYHPSANLKQMSQVSINHLSGATMADIVVEPSINLISASASISQTSRSSMANSKRCSVASTTKSSLRNSNHLLIEMLQNITTELAAHRSILLDVQSRVSHLEHESINNDPPLSALRALEGQRSKRNSRLLPPEGQAWWEACQNFARNSEEPMSAKEFLRTPRRFSGFDWKYSHAPSQGSHTPPATPPTVDEVPTLTPTSEEEGDHSDVHTPTKHDITIKVDEQEATPKTTDIETDIKEHTVEVDKNNMPPAPVLLPPPVGKPMPIIPEAPVAVQTLENPQRYYKGIKSATTYRALMKNNKSEKGKSDCNVDTEALLTTK
jgi:hypothetical protein